MELGAPDASGRPRPVPRAGSEFEIEATTIIAAISQEPRFRRSRDLARRARTGSRRTTRAVPGMEGVFAGGDDVELGLVTIAISQGRFAAEAIDAWIHGKTVDEARARALHRARQASNSTGTSRPSVTSGSTCRWPSARPEYRRSSSAYAEAEALEEAKRCMSCGMCMDCETCWMYCTNNCFVKLPKGEHYKVKLELCNGCKKCAEACPCGYIEMN